MRKISSLEIVTFHKADSPREFIRRCCDLVQDGFTPYGKPYTHGEYLLRDFVKYEYFPAGDEEYEDDEYEDDEDEEEEEVIQHPWETEDFFTEIGDI